MEVFVVIVFLAIPATLIYFVWMVHASRRREALSPAGHCQHCGYDLRASHSRCPECGRAVPGSAEEESDRIARQYVLDPHRLSSEWPATPIAPRVPSSDEVVIAVHSTANRVEANCLQQQLETRGISCRVAGNQNSRRYREAANYRVVVAEGDKQLAIEIIDTFRNHALIKPLSRENDDPEIEPRMGTDSADKREPIGPPPIPHP